MTRGIISDACDALCKSKRCMIDGENLAPCEAMVRQASSK